MNKTSTTTYVLAVLSICFSACVADEAISKKPEAILGTPGITQSQLMTSVIPISPPSVTGPIIQQPVTISGAGSATKPLVVPISTVVGEVLSGVRVRLTDSPIGPTTAHVIIVSTTDDAESFSSIATSPSSTGSGVEQTVGMPLSQTVTGRQQYFALVTTASGGSPCEVWRIELDYTMPLPTVATGDPLPF